MGELVLELKTESVLLQPPRSDPDEALPSAGSSQLATNDRSKICVGVVAEGWKHRDVNEERLRAPWVSKPHYGSGMGANFVVV